MDWTEKVYPQRETNWSQLPAGRQKLRDRAAIRRYVEEIGSREHDQLCVLYLNRALDLIGAIKWCGESAPALGCETELILSYGKAIGAEGFVLARRDSSEEWQPDRPTVLAVSKLRRLSAELDLPLLDYLVLRVGQTLSIGGPQGRDCD